MRISMEPITYQYGADVFFYGAPSLMQQQVIWPADHSQQGVLYSMPCNSLSCSAWQWTLHARMQKSHLCQLQLALWFYDCIRQQGRCHHAEYGRCICSTANWSRLACIACVRVQHTCMQEYGSASMNAAIMLCYFVLC